MKNLFIDMDNTAFDFTSQYLHYHYLYTGNRVIMGNEDYDFFESLGMTDENKYSYLRMEGFFETMPPMDNMVEVVNHIHHNTDFYIVFVSNAVVPEAPTGKIKCLESLFSWFHIEHNFISMGDKHLLAPGVIIDDNPYVLNNSKGHHYTIAFDHPWNRSIEVDARVYQWDDQIIDILNQIQEGK